MIKVQTEAGNKNYILDPSLEQNRAKLWSEESWQKQLYTGEVESISFSEMKNIIEAEERNRLGSPSDSEGSLPSSPSDGEESLQSSLSKCNLPRDRVFFYSLD